MIAGGPSYAQHFARSRTSFLTAQVTFENGRFGENEFDYEVMVGLYTYDNRPISANKKRMVVAADWKYAWTSQSYGWEEAGKWSVGTYRIKAWVNGELAGETAFYLFDDEADPEALKGEAEIDIDKLELFEGGEFFRPGLTKTAATSFSRRTTRRIYWVVRAKNRLHEVRAQHPNVIGYFYRPDGTLMGETPNRFLIAPEVKDIVLVEGIGWPTPGNWDVGTYRFELEGGRRQIVSGTLGATTASFKDGTPFTLTPDDRTSGWIGRFRGIAGNSAFQVAGEVSAEEQQSHIGWAFRASLRVGL